MTREERSKYALKWVNRMRKTQGLAATRLPRGIPGAPGMNPVGLGLLRNTGLRCFIQQEGGTVIMFGDCCSRRWDEPEVAEFMRDYDAGVYPELTIPLTPIKIKKMVVA